MQLGILNRHVAEWLRIVRLKVWIGFVEFVLSLVLPLATFVGLTIFISNKPAEVLNSLLRVITEFGSVAGIVIGIVAGIVAGVRKIQKRQNRRDDD